MLESAESQNYNLPAIIEEGVRQEVRHWPPSAPFLPAHIVRQGEDATKRFYEFFAAEIENDNTRATYYRAVQNFFLWCDGRGFHECDFGN